MSIIEITGVKKKTLFTKESLCIKAVDYQFKNKGEIGCLLIAPFRFGKFYAYGDNIFRLNSADKTQAIPA